MVFKIFPKTSNSSKLSLPDLIRHEEWDLVVERCKKSPHKASTWSYQEGLFDGEHDLVLPIHQACALHPPEEVIDALIESYPQGLRLCEKSSERLPLHVACQTNACFDTIVSLIAHYPDAVRCKDSFGRLPIHYSCSNEASAGIIDLLLRTFPASAQTKDRNGWLPIHIACSKGLSIFVMKLLLDSFPQSVDMLTKKGSTPIMCAEVRGHRNLVAYLKSFTRKRLMTQGKSSSSPAIHLSDRMPRAQRSGSCASRSRDSRTVRTM